ncbi:MAG: gfo/Idh/MocA family oxidoreductase, partial [Planctomycetes bacterium]|nr:gfo/Idh/MocA family oxidoreductase [Planctomycetota bacterium]
RACELVRNGRIGKISHVEVGLPTGGSRPPMKEKAVPASLDWDMWLGPAPWREHVALNRDTVHWNWRWVMDYSGGQLTDWSGHHIDIAHWGMGLDRTGPVEMQGKGVFPQEGLYNTPTEYRIEYKYANGLEMTVANQSQLPHGRGACWYGDKGWIYVTRGALRAEPASILKEIIEPGETRLYKSSNHVRNFLDCVKSRAETIAPAEVGHRSISVGLLGEIAMLTGRKLKWDPDKEVFTNDADANRYLTRAMRSPWHL